MKLKKINNYGVVEIDSDVLKKILGFYVSECYGIVNMVSKDFFRDGLSEILKHNNYKKGIIINVIDGILNIDLYVILDFNIRISEIIHSIQEKIKYDVQKNLRIEVGDINIFVQNIEI